MIEQSFKDVLVTIAIPAYKSFFLKEAIESALKQDYYNIELLIINDASPYDIDGIVASFSDTRIKYIKNTENLGSKSIVLNWNKCLSLAKGAYFVLLCDDDVLMPNFLSELLNLASKYPLCNIFHARKYNIYPDGHQEESSIWPEFEDGESYLRNSLNKKRQHTVTEFMYRVPFFQKSGYICFPIGYYSDCATVIKISERGGIASSDKCLVKFRFSDSHISSSTNAFYSLEKVKASIAYWNWIHDFKPWIAQFDKQIREDVQSIIYYSFINSTFLKKFAILLMVPNNILNLKLKIGFILKSLK